MIILIRLPRNKLKFNKGIKKLKFHNLKKNLYIKMKIKINKISPFKSNKVLVKFLPLKIIKYKAMITIAMKIKMIK